jgi:hypothetical protein
VNLRPVEMKVEAGTRVAAGKVVTIPVAVIPVAVDTRAEAVDTRVAAAVFPEVVVASLVAALVSLADGAAAVTRAGAGPAANR